MRPVESIPARFYSFGIPDCPVCQRGLLCPAWATYAFIFSSTCPPAPSTCPMRTSRSSIASLIYSTVFFKTKPSLRPWPSSPGTSSVRRSKPSLIACRRFCSARVQRSQFTGYHGANILVKSTDLMQYDSASSPPPSVAASRPALVSHRHYRYCGATTLRVSPVARWCR